MREGRLGSGFEQPAPHLRSPLRSQPLPGELLCCSNPDKPPMSCSFGKLLCSFEWRERFSAGSPQFPGVPLLARVAVLGRLAGDGWCWWWEGPVASSLPWGKSFHIEMSLLGLSNERDTSLQNSRGKRESVPPALDNKLQMAKGRST